MRKHLYNWWLPSFRVSLSFYLTSNLSVTRAAKSEPQSDFVFRCVTSKMERYPRLWPRYSEWKVTFGKLRMEIVFDFMKGSWSEFGAPSGCVKKIRRVRRAHCWLKNVREDIDQSDVGESRLISLLIRSINHHFFQ